MSAPDFFRARLDATIDLNHPLAILRDRFPWAEMEAILTSFLARKERENGVVGLYVSFFRRVISQALKR
ncbi:MAG: transposase, family [Solimicrobium sp.]|jgi:IS5 family transposase|nr:transposase, family [Solimicrobium sp.]